MIQLKNIHKLYSTERMETQALSNINLTIEEGELVSIMGPSGCGKSTLLSIMGLLDRPTEGRVTLGGQAIDSYEDGFLAGLRNRWIGFVFQSFHLIPDLQVVDNVEIPLLYRKMSGKERRGLALEALERVGLGSRVHHFPNQLSGGQQQRVALARAVVGRPRLLLADEPTGNLDPETSASVFEVLGKMVREDGLAALIATHNLELAAQMDRTVRLDQGKLSEG